MNENEDAFDAYAMKYDFNEDMIAYKYNHSYRVVHQAEEIARNLELDEEDKVLASNIALLHDIARFRQWTEYKTFKDHESIDHGDEAIKILFDEGEIKNFNIKEEDIDVLKTAICLHNKKDYDESKMSEREILHTEIIRDADKLDIIYSFSTNILLEIEESDDPISEEVAKSIYEHTIVDKRNVKNKNDDVLKLVGLVFDLNFDYSKERILKEKYIDKLYEHIKNKKLFKPYFDEIKKYLKGDK